ncbi:anaphase-promoting complex subunit 5-like [Mytilus galloprovincialis]|uniref:anaphase-promoting complex subunit 5-like n=1 Tax=Mytilus galloprovincialis TaxID=29158 RepID=UPI003F7BEEE8
MSSASNHQKDLFIFGPFGKKPLKEQVTPHKISLMVLIYEYIEMRRRHKPPVFVGFGAQDTTSEEKFKEREKRDFMTSILKLIQSPNMTLKDLTDQVQPILKQTHYEIFAERLKGFYQEGVLLLMDFFQDVTKQLSDPSNGVISASSILGLFLRRMIVAFEKLSFSQVTKLFTRYKDYYEAGQVGMGMDESDQFGGSLIDSITSQSGRFRSGLGLGKSFERSHHGDGKSDDVDGGFFSYKQAEYFISRQGFLLQHNENEALSPAKLQEKITDMLRSNPDMAEAHFLSYLNSLRVKEYCTALHNLYHYFDRNTNIGSDGSSGNKNREEAVSRRYAALNLASLHYRFGHRDESLAALHEAIRMAQETNDHECLQHALSWLHRLEEPGTSYTANLMARSVWKSEELNLPNITSMGVQSLARNNAFATAKPASVFEFLLKSDLLNCQHSQSHFMCVSYAQKSALWEMYGKRESSAMCSLLVLNLNTAVNGIFHNGEAVCIALCNVARCHADDGNYSAAFDIISSAKQRFPKHTQHAHTWMICEQQLLFDRAVMNRKFGQAETNVTNIRALNEDEAVIRNAILNKEKGEVTQSLTELTQLLEKVKKDKRKYVPDFPCRVYLALAELFVQTGNHTSSLSHVLDCITHAKEHHLQYMVALATVHLSFIQFLMQLPQPALELLRQQLLPIISRGNLFDKARTMYCYVRCLVAAANKGPEQKKRAALVSAVNMMDTVIDYFKQLEAHQRIKDAVYYQARLYNELGKTAERNKCAYQFKQLDSQYPTFNKVSVCVL